VARRARSVDGAPDDHELKAPVLPLSRGPAARDLSLPILFVRSSSPPRAAPVQTPVISIRYARPSAAPTDSHGDREVESPSLGAEVAPEHDFSADEAAAADFGL